MSTKSSCLNLSLVIFCSVKPLSQLHPSFHHPISSITHSLKTLFFPWFSPMDSTHMSNENSSDQKDTKEMVNNENSSTARFYDCTFCKRGFTNAQALGGHMNIHRKDKAKAKKHSESSVAHKASEYLAPRTSEQEQLYASLKANTNYQIFGSSPNLNYSHALTPQRVSNRDFSTPYRDFLKSSLNLRIGAPMMEENREELKSEDHGDTKWFGNDHVDLELRLGQNP